MNNWKGGRVRLIAPALKAGDPERRSVGSNPTPSATSYPQTEPKDEMVVDYCPIDFQ